MTKSNRIIILIILCSLPFSIIKAQTLMNLSNVDKLTYKFYNEQNWGELIKIGEKALKEDIDFYYLQYRMGVAYYSIKKYRKAIPHFENVVSINSFDAIAKEYLYYSYLFGGRISDANNTLYKLDKKHREKVEFQKTDNLINGLGLEYKYFLFDDYAINKAVDSEIMQKVRNKMNYFSVDLINYTSNNSTFYLSTSLINGENSVFNLNYSPEVITEDLKQYQIHFSWNKRIYKGININASFTYMRESLKWYDPQYSNVPGSGDATYVYNGVSNNFVGTLSFTKSDGNFDYSIGSTFSKINNEKQSQPFVNVIWYPFSNKSFYSNTNVSYQYNFNSYNDNFVFKQSFIAEVSSKFSINVFGLYGKIYNYVDDNGTSIYNNLDALEYWYGINANYYFNKTTQVNLTYRNDRQTNNYTDNNIDNQISYNVNSIFLGLRFSF